MHFLKETLSGLTNFKLINLDAQEQYTGLVAQLGIHDSLQQPFFCLQSILYII